MIGVGSTTTDCPDRKALLDQQQAINDALVQQIEMVSALAPLPMSVSADQ
ncbi:hypothetical protein [Rubripirellula lacrimiformis]|nr:hypothetical protein [Rubripirellula lacrimiformis]